jgi:hypothetical protein
METMYSNAVQEDSAANINTKRATLQIIFFPFYYHLLRTVDTCTIQNKHPALYASTGMAF